MIQKQGDDGDHNFGDKHWGKIPRAHVLMHAPTQSLACKAHTHTHTHSLTHSLTHALSLPHTQRLPAGYRDLIEFFSRNPGLVKWTGIPLLLYFNAGSLDAAPMFTL